jgi:citrate lyase subunit beta-like protein
MRARRALLYMPGDDRHKIEKAATLEADCICMDMEDGVAPNRKAAARAQIAAALQEVDFPRSERLVRINAVGSGLEQEDLTSTLAGHPDGVVIPKVTSADSLKWVSTQIEAFERRQGWPSGGIVMIAIVESALGIVNLAQIATADPRLQALVFGAEDLASDMGARRSVEAWEVFYARSALVTHAKAHDLQAIDMVYVDFHNLDGLRREADFGAQLGFSGKQVIHPNQVAPVQEAFTPPEALILRAQKIVQAAREHERAGKCAFALDGKMVDAPIVKAAERILDTARAAGKI